MPRPPPPLPSRVTYFIWYKKVTRERDQRVERSSFEELEKRLSAAVAREENFLSLKVLDLHTHTQSTPITPLPTATHIMLWELFPAIGSC